MIAALGIGVFVFQLVDPLFEVLLAWGLANEACGGIILLFREGRVSGVPRGRYRKHTGFILIAPG